MRSCNTSPCRRSPRRPPTPTLPHPLICAFSLRLRQIQPSFHIMSVHHSASQLELTDHSRMHIFLNARMPARRVTLRHSSLIFDAVGD
ncbi:hypothetical protein CBOM_07470 [Ceraceosorus bombacis]|uniref:Uncharacterized protein n=1 Tax=Ceraceosorus bombacis TaxID=401625 RepID=A0A0P1BCI1_9BASI|nr:hypothetical protein CBOM_07470 [Ceraceosorus bombacis]